MKSVEKIQVVEFSAQVVSWIALKTKPQPEQFIQNTYETEKKTMHSHKMLQTNSYHENGERNMGRLPEIRIKRKPEY